MPDTLSDEHYHRLAGLIEKQIGIKLPSRKQAMVESRLRKRLRSLGIESLAQYGRRLFEEGDLPSEIPYLIDCITTNKTDFFREPDHFHFLRYEAVPSLLGRRAGGGRHHLKVWSAACSIGAEAYTAAMVLAEAARESAPFTFSILGTDISNAVLLRAGQAVYPEEMMEPVPLPLQRRYVMLARHPTRREVRMVPELRRTARFERLNLMDSSYPAGNDFDVIFCRNVLIYFSKPVQAEVLSTLIRHLRPGGYLILGHSESMTGGQLAGLRQVVPTIYRKTLPDDERD